jgi:2-alkenal reductase
MAAALPAFAASPAAARQDSPATPTVEPLVSLVQQVGPAVVTVTNLQTAQGLGTNPSGGFNPEGRLQPAGTGTGFIISEDGYIVTNWHVVTGGEEFQVTFADGETRPATLIGSDQVSDLAVVQVEGDIPGTVALGDSEALQPGQTVVAIGSPLGAFENTVTEGIVSAVDRDFPAEISGGTASSYNNLIQHDAVINPGNSGGPLFNLSGEVIGVNTLGIPAIGGQPVQGLFFAIPSNVVRSITDEIIATGEVTYPFLGVVPVSNSPQIAAQYGFPVETGAIIADVTAGSPADEAGIQVEDIITAIDGQTIDQENTFSEVLYAFSPGDTVEMTIQRGEEELTVEVTLDERPNE